MQLQLSYSRIPPYTLVYEYISEYWAPCAHVFVVPHRPSCLGSDRAPRRVAGRVLLCVLRSTTGRAGACRPDCLAAKEVLRPVEQRSPPPPPLHPPTQWSSADAQVQLALLCTQAPASRRVGWKEKWQARPHAGPQAAQICSLCRSLDSLFISLSLSLLSSSFAPNWIEEEKWKRGMDRKGGRKGEGRRPSVKESCWQWESRNRTVNALHYEQLEATRGSPHLSRPCLHVRSVRPFFPLLLRPRLLARLVEKHLWIIATS